MERQDQVIQQPYQRYQPGLPTVGEAHQDYSQVTSDHVPILVYIPIDGGQVSILSWNVLETDSANGFAVEGTFGETQEQTEARLNAIIEAIVQMASNLKPDFICLQEISAKLNPNLAFQFFQTLQDRLDKQEVGYAAATHNKMVLDFQGNITFYKKAQYECINDQFQAKELNDKEIGGLVSYFKDKLSLQEFRINNVHVPFSHLPQDHEPKIQKFLTQDTSRVAVVVGDFNVTVTTVGPDSKPQNLVTSVATTHFRYNSNVPKEDRLEQGAFAIDGAFYHLPEESVIRQPETLPVDPKDAVIYQVSELPPLDTKTMNDRQKSEVNELRLVMILTEEHKAICEKWSAEIVNDFGVKLPLRLVANINGELGPAIIVDRARFERMQQYKNLEDTVQFSAQANMSGEVQYIVSSQKRHMALLFLAYQTAELSTTLEADPIQTMGAFEAAYTGFDAKNKKNYKAFSKALGDYAKQPNATIIGYSAIINAFHNLADFKINPRWQETSGLFRQRATKLYQPARECALALRKQAFELLKTNVAKITDPEEKLKLLKWSREQTIFSAHRNRSWLLGAWGRTATVKQIDKMIAGIEVPRAAPSRGPTDP